MDASLNPNVIKVFANKTATADRTQRAEKTPFFNPLDSPHKPIEKRASDLNIA